MGIVRLREWVTGEACTIHRLWRTASMIRKLLVSLVIVGTIFSFAFTAGAVTTSHSGLSTSGGFEAFAPEAFTGTASGECNTTQEEWLLCMTDCIYAGGNWRTCAPLCNALLCD